jgi:hypothetical protein
MKAAVHFFQQVEEPLHVVRLHDIVTLFREREFILPLQFHFFS